MKRAYIDVETGGLDSKKNALLQVAVVIEGDDGAIMDSFESYVKPPEGLSVEADALAVNGLTFKQIDRFPTEASVFKQMIRFLNHYVDRFDKTDKLMFTGYNSRFDMDFMIALFERNNNKFFGAYFSFYDNDTYALVKLLVNEGLLEKGENLKLETLCKQFDIKIKKAHDAISDIKATRKLHKKLVKQFFNRG